MLAVIRPWVPDTHENRVVCRVIADFRAILARRGAGRGKRPAKTGNDLIEERLNALWHVCTDMLERSPLASVRPASSFTPNNVLLGDRDYRRVWKLATWLRLREEHFASVWSRGTEMLAAAVMLAVDARLLQLSNTYLAETWIRITPGGADGCTVRELSDLASESRSFRWWLCNLREGYGTAFGIHQSEDIIAFHVGPAGKGESEAVGFTHATARVEFMESSDAVSSGEAFSCSVLIGETTVKSPMYRVPGGLAECAAWILESLGIYSTPKELCPRMVSVWNVKSGGVRPEERLAAVGVDLFGAGVRVAGCSEGTLRVCGPAAVACWKVEGKDRWVAGAAAAYSPRNRDLCKFFAMDNLMPLTSEEVPREAALPTLIGTAMPHIAPAAEWAVAIPDEFDEVDCQTLRSSLPSNAGMTTLIWRSVAAALRWRVVDTAANIGDGDRLIVVDGEASRLAPVPLVARYDEGQQNSIERLYWERASVGEALALGQSATASQWLSSRARAAVSSTAAAANESHDDASSQEQSLVEQMCQRDLWEEGRWCWVQDCEARAMPAWHRVRCTAADEEAADQQVISAFDRWFAEWSASHHGAQLRDGAGTNRTLWHFVGRPFDRPAIRQAVRTALQRHEPGWECSFAADPINDVVAGAAEYTARRARNLPTWQDIVPDLYLKAGAELIPLFVGQHVAPGQDCEERPPQVFELPAGRDVILLPLVRDRNTRRTLSFTARLASPEYFPLSGPIRVKVEVRYRHAQDGFRIRLVPQTKTLFDHLDVMWAKSIAKGGTRTRLNNGEPGFPDIEPWSAVSHEDVQHFIAANDHFAATCRAVFSDGNRHRIRHNQEASSVVADLIRCENATNACDAIARRIWTAARAESPSPDTVQNSLREMLFPWSAIILGVQSFGPIPVGFPRSFKNIDSQQIISAYERLKTSLRRLLSRLRQDLPVEWVRQEFKDISEASRQSEDNLYRLGRLMDCRELGFAREIILWAMQRAHEAAKDKAAKDAKPFLAMLTVGLWCHGDLVRLIDDKTAERCLAICEAMFEALEYRWGKDRAQVDVHAEACAIVLALLRRRQLEDGKTYRAGTERMTRLADAIVRVDTRLVSDGRTVKSRLRLGRQECDLPNQSLIADEVCAALRGERAAHIRAFKDD